MKIIHISDTHNQHNSLIDLPIADMIIHSGDVTFAGSDNELSTFLDWFVALPYKYKIFIAGNHDECLFDAQIEKLPKDCFYLCNSSITIEGLNFFGLPMFMNDVMSSDYDKHIEAIHPKTDVLISHQPPYSVLDKSTSFHYGNRNLLQKILTIKPRYNLFGHIHDAYGTTSNHDTVFCNAAILNENYKLTNNPIIIDTTL